jgi:hypothetical protein
MAKKRTKKQKLMAESRHVNTQLVYSFKGLFNKKSKIKNASITENYEGLGSIKKDLFKSLIIAFLILISLTVIYLLS